MLAVPSPTAPVEDNAAGVIGIVLQRRIIQNSALNGGRPCKPLVTGIAPLCAGQSMLGMCPVYRHLIGGRPPPLLRGDTVCTLRPNVRGEAKTVCRVDCAPYGDPFKGAPPLEPLLSELRFSSILIALLGHFCC